MCTLCLHLNLNPQGALSFCPKTDTKNIRYIYDYNCLARIYFAGITTVVAVHISATKTNKKTRTSPKRRALVPGLHEYIAGGPDRAEPIKALTLTRTVTKAKIGSRG
jgi:hypothetical protein